MSSLVDRHLRIPKYLQLAEALRLQIASGELAPGAQLPSYVQMRQKHGATQNTVDKVFALLEQDGLIIRERSRGTFVRPPAEAQEREATGIIGLYAEGFLSDGNSSYWTEILRGMRDAATQSGRQLLLLDGDSAAGWDKVDGVVVCDWSAKENGNRLPVQIPAVSVLVGAPGIPSVVADDFASGQLATEHLLSLGHRRIGMLQGGDFTVMPLRLAGYRKALQDAGVTARENWRQELVGPYQEPAEFIAAGGAGMHQWLKRGWKQSGCTAVICQNDAVAIGAIKAIRESGLDVPGDISVVGHDGTDLSMLSEPSLTTIRLPLYDIGSQAIELMVSRLGGAEISSTRCVLPVHLVTGESTGPAFSPARKEKASKP